MTERLLPRSEVERLTGLKRSTIYQRMADGTFPLPRREPSTRSVRWIESEVQQWISEWIKNSVVGTMAGSESTNMKKAA